MSDRCMLAADFHQLHVLSTENSGMWTALALGALVVGLTLLKRGLWPRRTGDTPHCRGCGYNLTGLTAERCPECGRELDVYGKVFGERRRSVPASTAGIFLICIPVLLLVVSLAGIDIYPHCPTALLVFLLEDTPRGLRAWDELNNRSRGKRLFPSEVQQVAAKCLKVAGPSDTASTMRMVDWLGEAYTAGLLNSENRAWLERVMVQVTLEVRETVPCGCPVPYLVRRSRLYTNWLNAQFAAQQPLVNQKARSATPVNTAYGQPPWVVSGSFEGFTQPGTYHLEVPIDFTVRSGSTVYLRGTQSLSADFNVVSRDPKELVRAIDTPGLREELQGTIKVFSVWLRDVAGKGSMTGRADIWLGRPIPVDLAFRVFARVNGKEYPLGTAHFHKGRATWQPGRHWSESGNWDTYAGPRVTRMDVVLRGSAEEALNDVSHEEFWDGELVFSDVPVKFW